MALQGIQQQNTAAIMGWQINMLSISSEFVMKITIRRFNHCHICEDPGRLRASLLILQSASSVG